MKQKTKLFKILALAICLMLTLMMFSPYSMASITEDTDTANITVSGIEAGVKVSAYQLTTVNYDYTADQPTSTPYEWVESVKTWLQTNHTEYLDIDNVFNSSNEEITEEVAKSFYSDLAAAIKAGTVVLTPIERTVSGTATYPVAEENLTGSVTFTDCEMGTYLVLIENGYKVYTPSVVNLTPEFNQETNEWELRDQTITVKSTNPQITKTVTNDTLEKDNYSTKDTISFKIVADVPQYISTSLAKKFYISDDLSNGLTLNASSIKISGQKGSAPAVELTETTDYELTTESATRPDAENTPVDFSINFVYDNISSYDKIIVEYTAKLAQGSTTVIGGEGNTNTAYLDYSNNPYIASSMQTQTDSNKVYTYGAEITKIDKNKDEEGQDIPLTGAVFTLSLKDDAEALYFVKIADGTYYLANQGDQGEITQDLAVDSNGKLYLYGLDAAEYSLTETKAPDGYNKSTTSTPIIITDDDVNGALNDEQGTTTGIVKVKVENSQGFQLPVTGGIGTVIFAASGIVFVGLGLVLLTVVIRKNKKK